MIPRDLGSSKLLSWWVVELAIYSVSEEPLVFKLFSFVTYVISKACNIWILIYWIYWILNTYERWDSTLYITNNFETTLQYNMDTIYKGLNLLLTWESNLLVFYCWNFLRWLDTPRYYLIQSGMGVIVRSAQRNTQTVKKSDRGLYRSWRTRGKGNIEDKSFIKDLKSSISLQ